MDEDEIKTILKLVKENNRLLRKIRRGAIIGNILRIIWWAVLIGLPIILYYYFLQPYVGQFMEAYRGFQGGVDNLQNIGDQLPSIPGLDWLFNIIKGQQ